jgi:hypothetical protein
MAQSTPVIAQRRCEILASHIKRSGGGWAVGNYEEFAAALEVLLERPEQRDRLGAMGANYVQANYGSADDFRERLIMALHDRARPLIERMRHRGLERAAEFDRAQWRQRFGAVVENVLHAGTPETRETLQVQPRMTECKARVGSGTILVGVRVVNRGTCAAVATGPGRTVLTATVVDNSGRVAGKQEAPTALPALLMPGRALSACVAVAVPSVVGCYEIRFGAGRSDSATVKAHCGGGESPFHASAPSSATLALMVEGGSPLPERDGCLAILEEAQAALVEANRLHALPDDYTDITEGALAGLRQRIKKKLLGNFKKAYVDVLSRQQSACNKQLLEAIQTLTECCATLDHAVRQLQARIVELEGQTHLRGQKPMRKTSEEAGTAFPRSQEISS